jgi:tetratricopeptide (TPR) repeat protein
MNTPRNKVFSLGIALPVVAVIGLLLLRQVSEYDIWFHMAMGKEILRSAALPVVDRFSLLNYGRPYHDSQWLFQVVAAAGYRVAGALWLQAMQIGCWGLAFAFVYRACRAWSPATGSWLLVLVTALACEDRFSIRPEIVTVLMVALYYWWLQQDRYRSLSGIAVLTLMQVVWTNCHGVYVIGPFMVGCYLCEALYRDWRRGAYAETRHCALLLGGVTIGCLLTPHGLEGVKFTWLLMSEASPTASKVFKGMYDMAPLFGEVSRTSISFWFFYLLLAGVVSTLLPMLYCRKGELPLARTLIGAALFVTSLTGIRNMPLFAVVAAPLIAEYLSLVTVRHYRTVSMATTGAAVVVALLVWSPRPAWEQFKTIAPHNFGFGLSPDYVPLALPKLLDQLDFSGPVFNSQNLGGFYEFHGYPRRIPFFDGRFEAYEPDALLATYETVANAAAQPERWHALQRTYGFRGLLIENGAADAAGLLPVLATSSQWRLVYLDYAASFWLRADYPNLPPPVTPGEIAALASGASSYPNMENIFLFLDKANLYPELRLKLIEQANLRWENEFTLKNLGLLQFNSGNLEQAEKTFRRLLARSPRSRVTLTTLAQMALARGDWKTAESYLLRAIDFYPDDPSLRENLDAVRNRPGR